MTSNSNVSTTSQIIKEDDSEIQSYQLGNFVSNQQPQQNDQMKTVATLQDANLGERQDSLLLDEIHKLQQVIMGVQEKVNSIEREGVKGRDLDQQVIEALKDLKQYSSFFEQATFQMETKLLKTSLSIAQKIIGIEVRENSTQIAKETINSMMEKIKSASKVSIHLNPKDFIALKDQMSLDTHVSLQEDPNVTAGGVVIASDLGNFDGSIESKIQSMLASLDAVI
jgi:flagellar assembly protein FliH